MTDAILLNKSFDIAEELIKNNPENEDNIINDYINYIIKVKSKSQANKSLVRSATFKDDNEFDNQSGIIKIHNNFQRYNNEPILIPSSIPATTTETFNDYYNNITSPFKGLL